MLPPPEVLALLRCPADRAVLRLERDPDPMLVCTDCGRGYPITDGIPRLTLAAASAPAEP